MLLKDIISRIRFSTSTTDDLSGKTTQNLFTNASIIQQLKFALDKYASYTKAIESVYSTYAYNTTNVITAPADILRSQGLRFVIVYNKGLRYPLIERDPNNIYANFYVQNITGLPGWFLYFANEISLWPTNSLQPLTSTLTNDISATDTTIELATDVNIPLRSGRITIGEEKIYYLVKTGTTLSQCQRGAEGTTADAHLQGDVVTENNVHILYRKLHWIPPVYSDDRIDEVYANRAMEINDEHLEVICDYTTYKLLSKVDPERAQFYNVNFEKWLEEAKYQIQKGRSEITKTDEVRDAYFFEREESPYRYLLWG